MAAIRPLTAQEKTQMAALQDMAGKGFQVTESIYVQLHDATNGDPDKMVDELLCMTTDPTASIAGDVRVINEARARERAAAAEASARQRAAEEQRFLAELSSRPAAAPAVAPAATTAATATPVRTWAAVVSPAAAPLVAAPAAAPAAPSAAAPAAPSASSPAAPSASSPAALPAAAPAAESDAMANYIARLAAIEGALGIRDGQAAAATRAAAQPARPPGPPALPPVDELAGALASSLVVGGDVPSAISRPDAGAAAASDAARQMPAPPLVCVYVDAATPGAKLAEMKLAFGGVKGLDAESAESRIVVVNVSHEAEVASVLRQQLGDKFELPLALVRGQMVGGVERVNAVAALEGGAVLQKLVDGAIAIDQALLQLAAPTTSSSSPGAAAASAAPAPAPAPELQLGLVDYGITGVEYAMYGVGVVALLPIYAPYKLISWAWGSSTPSIPDGVAIDCLFTNWYSRHQLRTMVFGERKFYRIRPGYNDVRAEHEYEEVEHLKIEADPSYLQLCYHNGATDYLRAPPAEVRRMVDLIVSRSKTSVSVVDLERIAAQKAAAKRGLVQEA